MDTNTHVPIWEKILLTIPEAASLSNIGVNSLRKKAKEPGCNFSLLNGSHILIKRKEFEQYISETNTW